MKIFHAAFTFIFFYSGFADCQTPDQILVNQDRAKEAIRLMNTPFNFYGKVLDDKSHVPIAGASVDVVVAAQPGADELTSTLKTISDKDGNFSIVGVKGASIFVSVLKERYYTVPNGNVGGYGLLNGNLPSKDKPAIFTLLAKGISQPLRSISTFTVEVKENGPPTKIHLMSGRPVDMVATFTADKHDPESSSQFSWELTLAVPGGGICERKNRLEFVAPTGNYPASLIIKFPVNDDWLDSYSFDCFAKLSDGKYAQVHFLFDALVGKLFMQDGYLNPTGSPNLERDPDDPILSD